jgi:hypothetical protein
MRRLIVCVALLVLALVVGANSLTVGLLDNVRG